MVDSIGASFRGILRKELPDEHVIEQIPPEGGYGPRKKLSSTTLYMRQLNPIGPVLFL